MLQTPDTRIARNRPPQRRQASDETRAIPPHGRVSPDGKHVWPQPSPAARAIVYGGVALATAGLTAGMIILASRIAGKDAEPDHVAAVPEKTRIASTEPAATPPRPARKPARRKRRRAAGLRLNDITHAVQDASNFLTIAMAGFRGIANHANGISDQLRSVSESFGGKQTNEAAATRRDSFRGKAKDETRLHNL